QPSAHPPPGADCAPAGTRTRTRESRPHRSRSGPRRPRALDHLVLQRGNAERPQPPVGLRDERSPDRLRPVRPSPEPSREILEIRFQGLAVVPPRLAVDPAAASRFSAWYAVRKCSTSYT